jgi:hypothetical protein
MSIVPNRKLIICPIHIGVYSRAMILPAWWLKLNANPERIEIEFSLNSLTLRPVEEEEEENGAKYANRRQC